MNRLAFQAVVFGIGNVLLSVIGLLLIILYFILRYLLLFIFYLFDWIEMFWSKVYMVVQIIMLLMIVDQLVRVNSIINLFQDHIVYQQINAELPGYRSALLELNSVYSSLYQFSQHNKDNRKLFNYLLQIHTKQYHPNLELNVLLVISNKYSLLIEIENMISEEYLCINKINLTTDNINNDMIHKITDIRPVHDRIYLGFYQSEMALINLLNDYRVVIELERVTRHVRDQIEFSILDKSIYESYYSKMSFNLYS